MPRECWQDNKMSTHPTSRRYGRLATRNGVPCVLLILVLITAPGCAALKRSRTLRQIGWTGFTTPAARPKETRLGLECDYQPGKVPVIFIHGLLSHSMTWDETIWQLEADEDIRRRCQFWTYSYPTGASYLQSAAELRAELAATLHCLDPEGRDPALREVVLVGHSMGGLIAKLQVTRSENKLWSTVSDRPIDEIALDPVDRDRMEQIVFFEPQPWVKRVVFIATPHQGSRWTERPLARLGRSLVRFPRELQERYHQWLHDNRTVLQGAPSDIPTSIDHLGPDSPVLQATAQLPLARNARLHSIIGSGYRLPDRSRGDGVVSLASAHLAGVTSEIMVRCPHSRVHRHPETVTELKRILTQHVAEWDARPVTEVPHASTQGNARAYGCDYVRGDHCPDLQEARTPNPATRGAKEQEDLPCSSLPANKPSRFGSVQTSS